MADDKKKQKDVVTLYGGSNTTKDNETSTTVRAPKYITRTEEAINGMSSPEAQAEFEKRKNDLAASYGINPETGRIDNPNKYLSDVLHIDPSLMRRKREDEEKLNRRKQLESAFYNGMSVLGDMMTTAAGGNVYLRKADKHAREAHDNNLLLEREQLAEDVANAGKISAVEKAYAEGVQKLYDTVGKAYSKKVSKSVEQGGNSVTTKTGGDSHTSNWRQQIPSTGRNGGDGDGSGSSYSYINVKLKNGEEKKYGISKPQYDAATNLMRRHYDDILHRGTADNATEQEIKAAEDLRRDLIRVGAMEQEVDDISGKIQYKLNDKMLLQNGEFFQLTDPVRRRLEEETGGRIKFVTGQNRVQSSTTSTPDYTKGRGRLSRNARSSR